MKNGLNAAEVLANINACIAELEEVSKTWGNPNFDRFASKGYNTGKVFRIRAVCTELSIFDWWNDNLSMSQLKAMKKFVETAISLGFTGYVCFKVGAKHCSHGMWASTEESTDGYSPREGNTLFHSFRSGDNYWDAEIDKTWLHDKYEDHNCEFTLNDIKAELAQANA